MGQYQNEYMNIRKKQQLNQRVNDHIFSCYGHLMSDDAKWYNRMNGQVYGDYLDTMAKELEPKVIQEISKEVYQQVMENIKIGVSSGASQIGEIIANEVNSSIKRIGMK